MPFKPVLTPDFVARALSLTLPPAILSSLKEGFNEVVTDSRKITPGCLFVALKGETFDGHTFIGAAIEKGAKGILCDRGTVIDKPQGALTFFVDDTVEGFRKIAFAWRREFSLPVIAVAGSVGKTTTKEILTAILRGKYPSVLKTQGSQNGFVGIPITLMQLRAEHQAAVIEVGIDEIGAMKQHMELVGATASVLTTIGPEHLEKLRDVPTVAQEEGIALTQVAANGGVVAISLDDSWIRPHAKTIRQGKKVTFSLTHSAATYFGQYDEKNSLLQIGNDKYSLPLLGVHNAKNTLAAISICLGLGLTPSEIQKGLLTFKQVSGRSEVRELSGSHGRFQVLCDFYNANPTSTEAGILLLTQLAKGSSRIACLADMRELGTEEERFHRELATTLISQAIEHVFLFGPLMKSLQDELKKRNFQNDFQHFSDIGLMLQSLTGKIKSGDTLLIKGSRSMKMETLFEAFEKWTKA
jgi:UDP-N-acetylmuramoyl-tripeptide--D-alanyl-D-alanine ligase